MESTEVIIARLVLGYLKGEKCKSAYKEFIKTSSHLQDDMNMNLSKSKYLPTRFTGLTLEDILIEYFEISKIVQGRLESTNYYNECHSKTCLVQQLLYLLNKTVSSRTSTPCPRSPLDSNLDETSLSHVDHVSDVETTPAHTLPGNVRCTSEDSYLHKSSRKTPHLNDKSTTEANFPNTDKEDISEVLAQTLLENREFHEKIAQTINKVAEKQFRVSSELDKTIKTVVKETEEDPMFDRILDEIIGSTSIIDNKGLETNNTSNSIAKNSNDNFDLNRSKRTNKHSNLTTEYVPSYRSYIDSQKVEEQNNEAIRSIVANSKLGPNKHTEELEQQENNEVIVFDGSLDKYLIANTCNANTQTQPVQRPLYFNTAGGLVVVPSGITKVTGNTEVDSKQFYLVNKQPPLNWNVPTIKTPSIITEQDILSMPTVIVNDQSQKPVIESSTLKTVSKPPSQQIVPRPVIEVPNIEEYLIVRDAIESHQKGLKKVMYPKTKKRKPSDPAENCETSETTSLTTTDNINVENDAKSFPEELCKDQDDPPIEGNMKSVSLELKPVKPQVVIKETQAGTPPISEPTQKITPKSSSHVRNLDFSTPPKMTSTHKKTLKSKQGVQTPSFVQKKQAVKTLFKPSDPKLTNKDGNLKEPGHAKQDTKNKINKPASTWDSDLRAIVQPVEEVKNHTPKRKRTSLQKTKRKVKKATKDEVLNTTEHEAALLEAALQTPCKTNKEHCKTANSVIDTNKTEIRGVTDNVCVPSESEFKKSRSRKNSFAGKIENSSLETKIKDKCKQKVKENCKDNTNKMILSPSKLNASKRNIVDTENLSSNLADALTDLPVGDTKFITPDMIKENMHNPIKANRNITPMLDTPMLDTPLKNEFIPKTPGLLTPNNPGMDLNFSMYSNGFTPFTKMLEANLKGIDINSLPTPSMPITPTFPPFTPTIDLLSPYSNRPTDYSTSSSYYQPSDSEQNKSLEANLIELEKKPISVLSDIVIVKEAIISSGNGNSKEVNKHVTVKEQTVLPSGNNFTNVPNKTDQNKSTRATTVKEHLSIFNKNVIGKKNLNLMNRNISSSSSSSDDSTSSSSSNEDTWTGEQSNETVIFKKKPAEIPIRTYSLRNRSISTNNKQETINKPSETKECKLNRNKSNKDTINAKPTSKVNSKQCKENKVVAKPEEHIKEVKETITIKHRKKSVQITSLKQKVLKELEEKRLRTINKFKNVEQPSSDKSITKPPIRQAKFIKIKPIPDLTNTRRKPRKSTTPKKTSQSTTASVCSKTANVNKKKDASKNSLKSGSCQDFDKSTDKTDISTSDVEAQNLIEGLKERGIHLMHNKPSPTKKINVTSNEAKIDNEKTEHIDKVDTKSNLNHNEDDISKSISAETTKSELSTSQLESELRETFDNQAFEVHEYVVFDESKEITKTFEEYDTKVLKKTFLGKVFVEETDEEIDVTLLVSPFYTLLDFPSTLTLKAEEQVKELQKPEGIDKSQQPENIKHNKIAEQPVINKKVCPNRNISIPAVSDEIRKSDDDLMNYAITGSGNEEPLETSESPKRTKKRKQRNEENSHTEKKCKTLLKKINVDSFLNNIHGGS